jgi:hypothetical protein
LNSRMLLMRWSTTRAAGMGGLLEIQAYYLPNT